MAAQGKAAEPTSAICVDEVSGRSTRCTGCTVGTLEAVGSQGRCTAVADSICL